MGFLLLQCPLPPPPRCGYGPHEPAVPKQVTSIRGAVCGGPDAREAAAAGVASRGLQDGHGSDSGVAQEAGRASPTRAQPNAMTTSTISSGILNSPIWFRTGIDRKVPLTAAVAGGGGGGGAVDLSSQVNL